MVGVDVAVGIAAVLQRAIAVGFIVCRRRERAKLAFEPLPHLRPDLVVAAMVGCAAELLVQVDRVAGALVADHDADRVASHEVQVGRPRRRACTVDRVDERLRQAFPCRTRRTGRRTPSAPPLRALPDRLS